MTPYRAHGKLPSAARDPAHARLGLLLVAAGGVTSFAPLFALHFVGHWSETFGAVLAIGSALIIVGLLWSARDPGAGRLLAVVAAFLLTAGYNFPIWATRSRRGRCATLRWRRRRCRSWCACSGRDPGAWGSCFASAPSSARGGRWRASSACT